MQKLLNYLNSLSKLEREVFAVRCKTSVGYLRKAISTGQRLGAELSCLIEQESNCAVTRKDLHPEKWNLIWPELATPASPAPAPTTQEAAHG